MNKRVNTKLDRCLGFEINLLWIQKSLSTCSDWVKLQKSQSIYPVSETRFESGTSQLLNRTTRAGRLITDIQMILRVIRWQKYYYRIHKKLIFYFPNVPATWILYLIVLCIKHILHSIHRAFPGRPITYKRFLSHKIQAITSL